MFPRAIIERIGVLDKVRIGRGLLDRFHVRKVAAGSGICNGLFAIVPSMQRYLVQRFVVILLFLSAVAAGSRAVWNYGFDSALDQLASRGRSDLALAGDRLTSELQSSRELAVFVAAHPMVKGLLYGSQTREATNRVLQEIADKAGLMDLIVVSPDGETLAHARELLPEDHASRADFVRAMDGALGVSHAMSKLYGRRIFRFAAPVFGAQGPVLGAVVAITDVEAVEAAWRGDRPTVFFTDEHGVIFVSNRSELLFRAREGTSSDQVPSEVYETVRVAPFVDYVRQDRAGYDLWDVDGGRYLPSQALHFEKLLPTIGLRVEALLDVAPARQLAFLQAAITAALCLAFGALLFLATERRRTLSRLNQSLEARVERRTEELQAANESLRREVAERIAAEARLKQMQAELVQAGKLSALGQMSAGISHELNQPLMAIRSFAENAETFLERGKVDVAAQNLGRISELARRMGRIIRNLRAFAKQEDEPLTDVDVNGVIEACFEIISSKAQHEGVALFWEAQAGLPKVRAGEVRLQQVVLNLISNAIDAMEGLGDKRVEVMTQDLGKRVAVSVRDHGPGIAEPEKIFDPFYSTKKIGAAEGMGLGLSISYGLVQSFGGAIQGRNHPEGGAVFTIELTASQMQENA